MDYIIEEMNNPSENQKAVIKVIGVGGGGTNMIDHMLREGTFDIDIYVANTDAQHLAHSLATHKIQLGQKLTHGLGAGSNPDIGANAAQESYDDVKNALAGAHLIFIAAGMGGGTGTGAAPVIAQAAKELEALTIGVVTMPFPHEGKKRRRKAEEGLRALEEICDQVIVIENQKLAQLLDRTVGFRDSYKKVDDILYKAVHGVSGIILTDGLGINVDFADVKTIMNYQGQALMGIGEAKGEDAARTSVLNALSHPLMDDITIDDAKGFLAYFQFHENYPSYEMHEAFGMIADYLDEDASDPIFGHTFDNSLEVDEVKVTIVATGIGEDTTANQYVPQEAQIYQTQERTPYQPSFNSKPSSTTQADPQSYRTPMVQNSDDDELDYPSFWKRNK